MAVNKSSSITDIFERARKNAVIAITVPAGARYEIRWSEEPGGRTMNIAQLGYGPMFIVGTDKHTEFIYTKEKARAILEKGSNS
jgi:hypothetical protein